MTIVAVLREEFVYVRRGLETHCTVPTRSYDRVKQLALNLHMQPQEFTLGEPLTIMRFYGVSFERTDSSRLRDFSHNTREMDGGIDSSYVYVFVRYSIEIKRLEKHGYIIKILAVHICLHKVNAHVVFTCSMTI